LFVASAPFRVSLLGGGSDYPEHFNKYGGATFGLAITDRLYISATRVVPIFSGHSFKFSYREIETVDHLNEIAHDPFRLACSSYDLDPGWEFSVSSNLPGYTGLGSSSSFLASLVILLEKISGSTIEKKSLVNRIFEIERNGLNQKVGMQDQVFSVHGGSLLIEFEKHNEYKITELEATKAELLSRSIVLISTGGKRRAENYVKSISENAEFNFKSMEELAGLAKEGFKMCKSEDANLRDLGKLIVESWNLKKRLSPLTSNEHVDAIIESSKLNGAFGAKLLGAGGSGFVAALVDPTEIDSFIARMPFEQNQFHKVSLDLNGTKVEEF